MHEKLIDCKSDSKHQHECSRCLNVIIQGKGQDIKESYEVEYSSLDIVRILLDFYCLFEFHASLTDISICQVVKIVVVDLF